eukprot:SAG31_NODE_7150_length_1773_cov_1.688172_1_plen_79_part_00
MEWTQDSRLSGGLEGNATFTLRGVAKVAAGKTFEDLARELQARSTESRVSARVLREAMQTLCFFESEPLILQVGQLER